MPSTSVKMSAVVVPPVPPGAGGGPLMSTLPLLISPTGTTPSTPALLQKLQ